MKKIFVAGHRGMVGSAILRALTEEHHEGGAELLTRTRQELDLSNQADVYGFLREERPDVVIAAAAKVGGIRANDTFPADFIAQNLILEHNLIWGSHLADVPKLLFLGSSCVYPREAAQPMAEEILLSGKPEPTNAPYAIAKIAGIYLCDAIHRQYGRDYFSVMPPNLYGPHDNFDLATSHVLPALIRKFHEALPHGPVEVWGSGKPKREFLYVDDLADACLFLLDRGGVQGHLNVGTGASVSIQELAETVQRVVGHTGPIVWNRSMPDGFPEKTMDVSKMTSYGWRPKTMLEEGIRLQYRWFCDHVASPASL
jgi:GDP-L-fucose synthase